MLLNAAFLSVRAAAALPLTDLVPNMLFVVDSAPRTRAKLQ